MLVGTRAIVNVHTEILSQELGCVAVTHDNPLQVRLEQADNIELELLDQVAHAVFRRPHVIVKREVNRPDARGNEPVVCVVGLVIVRGKAQDIGEEEEKVEERRHGTCGG
jgi:hypothetical protein